MPSRPRCIKSRSLPVIPGTSRNSDTGGADIWEEVSPSILWTSSSEKYSMAGTNTTWTDPPWCRKPQTFCRPHGLGLSIPPLWSSSEKWPQRAQHSYTLSPLRMLSLLACPLDSVPHHFIHVHRLGSGMNTKHLSLQKNFSVGSLLLVLKCLISLATHESSLVEHGFAVLQLQSLNLREILDTKHLRQKPTLLREFAFDNPPYCLVQAVPLGT